MQKCFFQCERFASATHIVSFHIGNMPYAPGTAIPFGPGLKNPTDLKFIFGRGLENLIRIRLRFVRGIENPAGLMFVFGRGMGNRVEIGPRFVRGMDFWVEIRFIRPLAWPFVGRMQYAPTLPGKNSSGFWFVFIRGIKNRIGINFIRPPVWPSMGRMLLRPTRVPEKMAIFLSVRPPVWPFVGRIQYAPTRAT